MIPIGYVQYHALKKRRNMFWVYASAPSAGRAYLLGTALSLGAPQSHVRYVA